MFLPPWLSRNERVHLQTVRHKENYSGRTQRPLGRETTLSVNSHLKRASPLMHQMVLLRSLLLEMKRRKYSPWTCKTFIESSLVFTLQCIWGWPKIPKSTSTFQELKNRLAPWVLAWRTDPLRRYSPVQTPSGCLVWPMESVDRFNFLLFFPRIIELFWRTTFTVRRSSELKNKGTYFEVMYTNMLWSRRRDDV